MVATISLVSCEKEEAAPATPEAQAVSADAYRSGFGQQTGPTSYRWTFYYSGTAPVSYVVTQDNNTIARGSRRPVNGQIVVNFSGLKQRRPYFINHTQVENGRYTGGNEYFELR